MSASVKMWLAVAAGIVCAAIAGYQLEDTIRKAARQPPACILPIGSLG